MTATHTAAALDIGYSIVTIPRLATDKKPPIKRVYVCSPYRGNTAKNTATAKIYCRFVYDKGYIPVAPHLYYPQFLDDGNPDERAAGLKLAKREIGRCKELWVFGLDISDGMLAEIEYAKLHGIHVRWHNENLEEI